MIQLASCSKLLALSPAKPWTAILALLLGTLLAPSLGAQALELELGGEAAAAQYRSGGTYGRSLERGLSLYANDSDHSYLAFNFRSDPEALQNDRLLMAFGFDIFAYHKDLATDTPEDNLALGLAYYTSLGYRLSAWRYPQRASLSFSYSPPGLANRTLARLYYYSAAWQLELNPEHSLSLGARRIDLYYSDLDSVEESARIDDSLWLGWQYKF